MSPRRLLLAAAGLLVGGLLMEPKNTTAPLAIRPAGLRLQGRSSMSRAAVATWASALGVPVDLLILAIVAGSERGHDAAAEHRAEASYILATILNRATIARAGHTAAFGDGTVWGAAVTGDATGAQGSGGRQYASSRPPTGDALAALLQLAHEVATAHNRGARWEWITHFHHLTGDRLASVEARRRAQGYQYQPLPGLVGGSIVRFMRPTAAKLAALLGRVA